MPRKGEVNAWDIALFVKVKPGAAVPDLLTASLFDENWQLPK